jgi:hypothetical protein
MVNTRGKHDNQTLHRQLRIEKHEQKPEVNSGPPEWQAVPTPLVAPVVFLKKYEKKLARSFNFTFCYIDDVLSRENSRFGDFVDHIYPINLEIKDTTNTDSSASYLDLHLEIDSECRLRTKPYDKRDE